jgi:hypothetical protein
MMGKDSPIIVEISYIERTLKKYVGNGVDRKVSMIRELNLAEGYPLVIEDFGLASLSDLFEDRIVYRRLEPIDRGLSGLKSARYNLGLNDIKIPRKVDPEYAKVTLWILERMQEKRRTTLDEVLFIGDTMSGDGQAFQGIRSLAQRPGAAFIAAEEAEADARHQVDQASGIYQANRWSSLTDFLAWAMDQGLQLGKQSAVVVDIDKTALGARGRNDRVIDKARLLGLYRTVSGVLEDDFNARLFEEHYNKLNRPQYHKVTEDNQDYLAYICLILNTGMIGCQELEDRMQNSSLNSFEQFVRWVELLIVQSSVSEVMRQVHLSTMTSVQQGDPTPFKRFRRNEFEATLEHMNNLGDDAPISQRLAEEITITSEVYQTAMWLQKRGCLVMSLSDKPDESSCPDRRYHRGLEAIHQAQTHMVGADIQEQLQALG